MRLTWVPSGKPPGSRCQLHTRRSCRMNEHEAIFTRSAPLPGQAITAGLLVRDQQLPREMTGAIARCGSQTCPHYASRRKRRVDTSSSHGCGSQTALTGPPEGDAAWTIVQPRVRLSDRPHDTSRRKRRVDHRPATGAALGSPSQGLPRETPRGPSSSHCCAANAHEDDVDVRPTRPRRCHHASVTTSLSPSDTNQTTPPTRHTCWLRLPPP
jgi:hypothetical protein